MRSSALLTLSAAVAGVWATNPEESTTTLTSTTTHVVTITECGPDVPDCPAHSTTVVPEPTTSSFITTSAANTTTVKPTSSPHWTITPNNTLTTPTTIITPTVLPPPGETGDVPPAPEEPAPSTTQPPGSGAAALVARTGALAGVIAALYAAAF